MAWQQRYDSNDGGDDDDDDDDDHGDINWEVCPFHQGYRKDTLQLRPLHGLLCKLLGL